jgi:hypothetical protein
MGDESLETRVVRLEALVAELMDKLLPVRNTYLVMSRSGQKAFDSFKLDIKEEYRVTGYGSDYVMVVATKDAITRALELKLIESYKLN